MTDRQTIIKQRVIIVLLVVVIIAGLMATAKMAENYAETNERINNHTTQTELFDYM